MSKRQHSTFNIICRHVNCRPETTPRHFFRASESQTVLIVRLVERRLKLINQENSTHDQRLTAQSPSLSARFLSMFSSQIAMSWMYLNYIEREMSLSTV